MKGSLNIGIKSLIFVLLSILIITGSAKGQTVTGFTGAAGFEQNVLYWDKYTASTPTGYEIYWQTTPGVSLSSNMIPSAGLNVSLVHSGLIPGTTYYYAIRVLMSGPQYSVLSNEIAVTPLTQSSLFGGGTNDGNAALLTCNMDLDGTIIPVSPTGLAAAPAPGSNYLYWDFVSGAVSYTVEWATDPAFTMGVGSQAGITNVSFVHNNVIPGLTYYYHVQPVLPGGCPAVYSSSVSVVAVTQSNNAGGGSGDGHAANITCMLDLDGTNIILSPSNLAVAASQSSAVLNWSPLSGALNYVVEIDSASGSFSSPRLISGITNISWTHYKAVPGLNYYYRVTANVPGGCSVGYSSVISVIPVAQDYITGGSYDGHAKDLSCMISLDGNSAAPSPTNLKVAASHEKNCLYWDALAGISSYTVRWSNDPTFSTFYDITGITDISYQHTPLSPALTYYYMVTATLIGGCPSGFTNPFSATPVGQNYIVGGSGDGYANEISCSILLNGNSAAPAPTGLSVAASYGMNNIYWEPLTGASSYIVRWSNDPTFATYYDIPGLQNISYVHLGLTPGITYYYKLTAALPGGCPAGITAALSATPISETHIAGDVGDGYSSFKSCMAQLDGTSVTVSPTGFTIASSHNSSVMYWDYVPDITSFTVRWSNDPAFNSYTDITGITNVSYLHAPLVSGTVYYYMVSPVFAGSCPAGFSNPISVDPISTDYINGDSGDGFSMFGSCFTMTLDGFDPVVTPPGPLYSCTGGPLTLSSTPAVSYQWFHNGVAMSGEINQDVTVTLPGNYVVQITNINNCYAWSVPTIVQGGGSVVFVANPIDALVCPGADTSFSVSVAGATAYQWQESIDGGLNWTNLANNTIYNGVLTNTLFITGVTNVMHNNMYQCVVTAGCQGTSSPAALAVVQPPVISLNPIDVNVCPGGAAMFSIVAAGNGMSYQWYENSGSGWVVLLNGGVYSNVTSDTLMISNTTGKDSYQYQCIVTSCASSETTSFATLTLQALPAVITAPANTIVCPGDPVSFSVTTNGSGFSYLWYENQGTGWYMMSNTGVYSGVNSPVMNIANSLGMNGYEYFCVINGCSVDVNSDTVILALYAQPSVLSNPVDVIQCAGGNATFSVTASGNSPIYQWFENSGSGWVVLNNTGVYSGASSSVLSISDVTGLNAYQYQCVITSCSASVTSNAASLNLHTAPVINVHPVGVIVCSGGTAFSVSATGTAMSFQWYENQGAGWIALSNAGVYSGASSPTLSIANVAGLNSFQYQCIVTTCSFSVTSNVASLTYSTSNLWLGYSTDWNNAGNWACGIPGPASDVTIPAAPAGGNLPLVFTNGISNCRDFTLEPGSGITLDPGSDLTVYGNWNNAGPPAIGEGKVIFAGTAQNVSGATTFEHIKINQGSVVNFVSSGQQLTGILLCDGVLNANANFTLLSSASGTALIDGSGTGSVLGTVTQQRFVPVAKAKGYKHFSSAFSNAQIGQFSNFMTLHLGSVSSIPYPTIFKFSEANATPMFGNGWVEAAPQGQVNALVEIARGYTAQIGSGSSVDITSYLSGEVNNGLVNIGVTRLNPGSGKGDGWNLVGNPYPSPIDLDKLPYTASNLNKSVSIFISTSTYNGYYGYYNAVFHLPLNGGTRYLGALHAFFVQCNDLAGGTLSFTNTIRSNVTNPILYKNDLTPDYPLIKLSGGSVYGSSVRDELAICFSDNATAGFDKDFDASKLWNTEPDIANFYSVSTGNALAINGLPNDFSQSFVIPLGYSIGNEGLQTIQADEIINLPTNVEVYLEDILKGYSQNLNSDPVYNFMFNTGDSFEGRFFLRFGSNTSYIKGDDFESVGFYAYSSGKNVFVSYNDPMNRKAEIEIFDLHGRIIFKTEEIGNGLFNWKVDCSTGHYLIKILSPGISKVAKIYLQ